MKRPLAAIAALLPQVRDAVPAAGGFPLPYHARRPAGMSERTRVAAGVAPWYSRAAAISSPAVG